jgi:DNA polymerase epsilon subunit 1
MVRRELLPLAQANLAKFTAVDAYADIIGADQQNAAHGDGDEDGFGGGGHERAWGAEDDRRRKEREPSECIIEIREHDIAYYLRVAIDLGEDADLHS